MYLGGATTDFLNLGRDLSDTSVDSSCAFGRRYSLDGLSPAHWAWMEKQIRRLEQHLFGYTRVEVKLVTDGFAVRAGGCRTVGRETGDDAVSDV